MCVFGDREGFGKECQRAILQSQGYDCNLDRGGKGGRKLEGRRATGILIQSQQEFLVRYTSHTAMLLAIMANLRLELISETRISAIRSLFSVVECFANLYCTHDIKCRVYIPSSGPKAPYCSSIPTRDARILSSLLTLHTTIRIRPAPRPPYKSFCECPTIENSRCSWSGSTEQCKTLITRARLWPDEEQRWRHGAEVSVCFEFNEYNLQQKKSENRDCASPVLIGELGTLRPIE